MDPDYQEALANANLERQMACLGHEYVNDRCKCGAYQPVHERKPIIVLQTATYRAVLSKDRASIVIEKLGKDASDNDRWDGTETLYTSGANRISLGLFELLSKGKKP